MQNRLLNDHEKGILDQWTADGGGAQVGLQSAV